MVITPTFTANFDTNFGANAQAARAAWMAAAQVFTSLLVDDIHINITVDAVPGTKVFGESFQRLLSIPYGNLVARLVADAKSENDGISIGPGGSVAAVDPTSGVGTWWLTRAQAKALGYVGDDMSEDGGTTFGAGHAFTFSGEIAAGTFDFQGIAAHEISEVMGRSGLSGGTVGTTTRSFSLIDCFSFTGPGARGLGGGPGESFSIDAGTTLLKLWNDSTSNQLDSRDWAPGTNDAFNQFSGAGVVNAISAIDLQLMDVLGYDTMPIADQLVSYGDAGTPGNVSDPVVVGFGGWLEFKLLFAGRNVAGEDRIYAVSPEGQLLSYGDAGTPGNVSDPVIVGLDGWLGFEFLFAGRNVAGEDRIYAVSPEGQLLSYGDAGTPGNVSDPVIVGFGGWLEFKLLFAGRNVAGEDRIYAVSPEGQLLSYGDAGTPGNVSDPVVVGLDGWLGFEFLFAGRNVAGEDRIYAVSPEGQLLSYGDAGTPGNVSDPVVVGLGGWLEFKFLFAGRNIVGEDRIYAVVV